MRIVRAATGQGILHLIVQGPGEASDTREFSDILSCMNYQSDLERRLVAEGYVLERFDGDRRSGAAGRPRGGERRRLSRLFL